MKKAALLLAFVITFMFSCKNGEQKEVTSEENVKTIDSAIVDGHDSRDSLDWAGVYEGTTPCADCEGIKTVLELNKDNSYMLFLTYLGKPEEDNEFKRSGNFSWEDDGSNITLKDGDDEIKYKVGKNQLLMLDKKGKLIDGKMSDLYILKKITD